MCQWSKIVSLSVGILLFLILFLFVEVSLEACPECGCKDRFDSQLEYIKLISLHPFKNKFIKQGNHDFFFTVSETASNTFDIFFYIENSTLKRAIRAPKEILIYHDNSATSERFVLESDITGVSSLRYIIQKPFMAKVRVSAVSSENEALTVETEIQIGSPKPSLVFFVIFGLVIVIPAFIIYRILGTPQHPESIRGAGQGITNN